MGELGWKLFGNLRFNYRTEGEVHVIRCVYPALNTENR